MNCSEFSRQLDAWLDNEVEDQAAQALEMHLLECSVCRSLADTARQEHERWRQTLAEPAGAKRVAAGIEERLAAASLALQPARRGSLSLVPWFAPLLYIAAGFALAMVALQRPATHEPAQLPVVAPPPAPPVARLVASTGRVERFDDARQAWVTIESPTPFACPTDSRLRTAPDVRCELNTDDGCVVRLNDRTEVTLLGSSSLALHQGQVWCRSPGEVSLELRVAAPAKAGQTTRDSIAQSTLWSVGPSCVMTGIQEPGRVQVMNAAGIVNLHTPGDQQQLAPGQVAEIANGQVTTLAKHADPLLTTSWMQPLLISRAGVDDELNERVDTLLAQIGRSKVATLYEQEIRSLGEHAVLPLIRFVQSPLANNEPSRRRTAMQLSADLAPVWLIPDLIDLLGDRDPGVRMLAAQTLLRLTALDMSLAPADWREPAGERQATALADWRAWWETHRRQYPTHRLRIIRE